jgi:AcrR family transcriptional regulator
MSIDRRTRKKHATRRALVTAARRLTLEHGLDRITVEQIADEAGVSPRTFFNYFSSKEEAVVGIEPTLLETIADAVESRPPDEDSLTALLEVMTGHADSDTEVASRWLTRAELARRHTELLPHYLEGLAAMEASLARAVAARRGDDVDDLHASVFVAAAVAAMRATIEGWDAAGRPVPLRAALDDAFDDLATRLGGKGAT